MRKCSIVVSLLAAFSLTGIKPASAQLEAGTGILGGPAISDTGTSGVYNGKLQGLFDVLIKQDSIVSTEWHVTVSWAANAGANVAYLDRIGVQLYNGAVITSGAKYNANSPWLNQPNALAITGTAGSVTPISGPKKGKPQAWNVASALFGTTPSSVFWRNPLAGSANITADSVQQGEPFTATIFQNKGEPAPTAVQFFIYNHGQGQQVYDFLLVPEGSAWALLLPGLIPVGIALRRRRAARK